jgi:thymidylate synthase
MRQYLDILQNILDNGEWKSSRTGVRCKTLTHQFFTHSMEDGFPLLTKRFIPFKSICAELWCFLNGVTSRKEFEEAGTKFWSHGWSNPDSDDPDDLGALYSWQMRKFGQHYPKTNDEGPESYRDRVALDWSVNGVEYGVDQIQKILDQLLKDPNDRRMLCINFCPFQLHNTALPSCHYSFGLSHVDGNLDLAFTMRSWDFPVGAPSNIASYALLLMLFAKHANLKPRKLSGFGLDVHLYENQIDEVNRTLSQQEYDLPTVKLKNKAFWDWTPDKTDLINYKHGGKIKFEVAV